MDFNYTFFVALSIVIVISVSITFSYKKNINKQKNHIAGNGNNILDGKSNTNISVGNITNAFITPTNKVPSSKKKDLSIDEIKGNLKVIFVDDKKFNIIDLLRKNGWKQVSYKRDIADIDSNEVREAHVLFLDINGVGVAMGFHNQGMGLCGALKHKYGDTKRVVLYSGETVGDLFDNDAKMADDTLKKDSDLYQFTALMEQYGKELL